MNTATLPATTDTTTTAAAPDLTAELASYAASIRLDEVPEAVRHQAKLSILDTIGCIVAGARVDDWKPLMAAESAVGAPPQATVLGSGRKLGVDSAARVNAYMGDVFELNDLIGGHASIGNVSALLALGESLKVSGAALVEALIVGQEVTARVYNAYYPAAKPYTQVGMAAVCFPSSYGVAAAAGRLLGLSEAQLGDAMGIAGTLAGWCPAEVVFGEGGTIKPMLYGACPASAGLTGARYAQAGMRGPRRLLEGPRGYFVTAANAMFPEVARDRSHWYGALPRRKLHACCGYIHCTVDLVAALRREGVDLQAAKEIEVRVIGYSVPAVSKAAPPRNRNEALFNLQYCAALAALGEDVMLPEFATGCAERAARPEVEAMRRKIRVVADPQIQHYYQSKVAVHDAEGREIVRREGLGPKGSPQNPMSDADVIDKFRRLVSYRMTGAAIDAYVGRLGQLDASDDWGWLVESFN